MITYYCIVGNDGVVDSLSSDEGKAANLLAIWSACYPKREYKTEERLYNEDTKSWVTPCPVRVKS